MKYLLWIYGFLFTAGTLIFGFILTTKFNDENVYIVCIIFIIFITGLTAIIIFCIEENYNKSVSDITEEELEYWIQQLEIDEDVSIYEQYDI